MTHEQAVGAPDLRVAWSPGHHLSKTASSHHLQNPIDGGLRSTRRSPRSTAVCKPVSVSGERVSAPGHSACGLRRHGPLSDGK